MPAGAVGTCWATNVWSALAWEEFTWADALALVFVLDINSRVYRYLCNYYSVSSGDLTSMSLRYMSTLTGDMNQRWHRLVQDATDAMT
jgi:hypothetical protein